MIDFEKSLIVKPVPRVILPPQTTATREEAAVISDCIRTLASAAYPVVYDLLDDKPVPFRPVASFSPKDRNSRYLKPSAASDAVKKIVSYGGKAIPFLLRSLDDATSTRIVYKGVDRVADLVLDGYVLWSNPFNPAERAVLTKYKQPYTSKLTFLSSYTVSVGDLCYDALGEILGRYYLSISTSGIGSYGVSTTSSIDKLCFVVRAMWSNPDSNQMLLDSLLIDLSIREKPNAPKFPDSFDVASMFQVNAAIRLLYYYPEIAVPLLTPRLDSLDVHPVTASGEEFSTGVQDKRFQIREKRNEVTTVDFVKAVSWCKDARIQAALGRIVRRTRDKAIVEAARG